MQRAQIGNEQDADDHGPEQLGAAGNEENDFGQYNNLASLTNNYHGSGKQFFILPEFQKFQHTFRKLNPRLI